MNLQHENLEKKGRHYLNDESGNILAEMTYIHASETRIIIDHTFVDDTLRGQGVGRKLLDATAAYAREIGLKILATCPYAKAQLAKNPIDFSDVYDG